MLAEHGEREFKVAPGNNANEVSEGEPATDSSSSVAMLPDGIFIDAAH
jgi:hypothetical protein